MFVVLLVILASIIVFKLSKSWNSQYTFRVDYEGEPVVITSQRIPPNFRKAKFKDEVDMLFGTCGMCKHFDRRKECCSRYGCTYAGVGCLVATTCDDHEFDADKF